MIRRLLELSGIISSSKDGSVVTHINAQEAAEKIKAAKVFVLDVRSKDEYNTGHLEGAKLIPVGELRQRIGELDKMKDKIVLAYCHSGMRSRTAASILASAGFTVMNLKGGISSWTAAGNPVNRGKK